MREDYSRIDVQPVTGALGADVLGIDLAERLDNETFSEIYDAFLDHLVLCFRDQQLTPDQLKDFARHFGDLHVHPLTEGRRGTRKSSRSSRSRTSVTIGETAGTPIYRFSKNRR